MTAFGITQQMQRVLDFIRAYQLEHGRVPSFARIGAGLGLKSKSNVHRLIHALVERGRIWMMPGKARSMTMVPVSPVLTVELPPHLYAQVQDLARKAKVTPEAVVIEAVRDGFAHLRSKTVPRETSRAA